MRHIVHATTELIEKVLKEYTTVISAESDVGLRVADLYVALDDLLAKSRQGLSMLHPLITTASQSVTPQDVQVFNDHVSILVTVFDRCYSRFKALRVYLWDSCPQLFEQLMVALSAKAFGTLGTIYHQSPGYDIDDRAKHEGFFLKAMLTIGWDTATRRYLIGNSLRNYITEVKAHLEEERYAEGFPLAVDIHQRWHRDKSFPDSDLVLRSTEASLPAELGSEAAAKFYKDRSVVVESLAAVLVSFRDYVTQIKGFSSLTSNGKALDASTVQDAVERMLNQSIHVHVRCDINLYIYSHTTIETSGALYCEESEYHTVRPLFGRRFIFKDNVDQWFPRDLDNDTAGRLGRKLFDVVFERPIREKYLLARDTAKARNIPLTFSLKALESNRDIPVSFTAPWELLHDDEGFLCLQYAFYRMPRGGRVYPLCKPSNKLRRALLIAANPGGDLDEIPEVDEEICVIADLLREMNIEPTLINSGSAKLETIIDALRDGTFQVLHFAGHGYYDAASSADSHVVVGVRGEHPSPLSARTLCQYARGTELSMVFVGSCYSAHGAGRDHMKPWEVLGLLDAFVQAGVPTSIGMQRRVSSQGASVLAQQFYGGLKDGYTCEEALRRARRHLGGLTNWQDMTWLAPVLIRSPV